MHERSGALHDVPNRRALIRQLLSIAVTCSGLCVSPCASAAPTDHFHQDFGRVEPGARSNMRDPTLSRLFRMSSIGVQYSNEVNSSPHDRPVDSDERSIIGYGGEATESDTLLITRDFNLITATAHPLCRSITKLILGHSDPMRFDRLNISGMPVRRRNADAARGYNPAEYNDAGNA